MKTQTEILEFLDGLEIPIKPEPKVEVAANIAGFSVTTDSVVATATVSTDGTMSRIVVDWGDGKTDTLRHRPGIEVTPVAGGDEPLPPGTYRFRHAYAEPEDREPFEYFVLVRVDDRSGGVDFRIQRITLTPRYKVTNYPVSVSMASQCDSIFESSNEFDIYQLIDGQPVNYWRWEPSNNIYPVSFRLEGSGVSRELTLADRYVPVQLQLTERDPVYDDRLWASQNLSATYESEHVEYTVVDTASGCSVTVRYDREVKLMVPMPSGGPVVVA